MITVRAACPGRLPMSRAIVIRTTGAASRPQRPKLVSESIGAPIELGIRHAAGLVDDGDSVRCTCGLGLKWLVTTDAVQRCLSVRPADYSDDAVPISKRRSGRGTVGVDHGPAAAPSVTIGASVWLAQTIGR